MNIFITGHSSGIGLAIYKQLSRTSLTVTGFSLSNNYDIADPDTIISQLYGEHVFINNAWIDFYQVEMFDKWYATFKDTPHTTIVNVGSTVATGRLQESQHPVYMASKKELVKHSDLAIADLTRECRIININPGWVNSRLGDAWVNGKLPSGNKTPMLTTDECADAVCWAINQPQHIEVSSLTIRSTVPQFLHKDK